MRLPERPFSTRGRGGGQREREKEGDRQTDRPTDRPGVWAGGRANGRTDRQARQDDKTSLPCPSCSRHRPGQSATWRKPDSGCGEQFLAQGHGMSWTLSSPRGGMSATRLSGRVAAQGGRHDTGDLSDLTATFQWVLPTGREICPKPFALFEHGWTSWIHGVQGSTILNRQRLCRGTFAGMLHQ